MPRLRPVCALLLASVVCACGSAATSSPAATATASPAGSAPGTPEPLQPGFPDAGTYSDTVFVPSLTMALDDGWQVLISDDVDEMALESDGGDGMMFLATRVSQVVNPTTSKAQDAPDDLVAWFRAHPSLVVDAPSDTTVDGLPARSIEATTGTRPAVDVFAYPTGNFHIPPGVRLRFTIVPMDGPDLVVTRGGPKEAFAAAIARTDQIVTSLAIGDR